jgi:hypothetical protein
MDHQALPAVDHFLAGAPDLVVAQLLPLLPRRGDSRAPAHEPVPEPAVGQSGRISLDGMGRALRAATGQRPVSLLHLPLSWSGAVWPFAHPLDFIGGNGGAGVGAGPGLSVGAALALRGSGRLPVGIVGDGDFLMGVTALWTAVHYRIPLLLVVANNRSLFNDEMHQERVARQRGRPLENRWIGQRIDDPAIDLAQMARAQGAVGWGPVADARELRPVFDAAIAAVEEGAVAVVDVHVEPGERPARPAGPAVGSGR